MLFNKIRLLGASIFLCGSLSNPVIATAEENIITEFFDSLFNSGQKPVPRKFNAGESGGENEQSIFGPAAEAKLTAAIQYYEKIIKNGGWPQIKSGPPLKRGDTDPVILTVRQRLAASGEISNNRKYDEMYDQSLHEAIVRFQTQHGLINKGIIGKQTLAALNVRPEVRLNQLRQNLARMKQLSHITTKQKAVIVNIPEYRLYAVKNGQLDLTSKVIVGRPSRQTPIFESQILGVNFFPIWNVPASIARRDLIPHFRKDPGYFEREKFKVLRTSDGVELETQAIDWSKISPSSVHFKQGAGPQNALGLIRINMPNSENVYMHDTPLKRLFNNQSRAYSSGCVRVEKIRDVASWILSTKPGWNRQRTDSVLADGQAMYQKLDAPIPVYFVYITSWVDNRGNINFREDLYKQDNVPLFAQEYSKQELPEQSFSP